jgi:hypothetical protein
VTPKRGNSRRDTARKKVRRLVASGTWTAISFVLSALTGLALLTELRAGPIIAALGGLGIYALLAYVIPKQLDPNTSPEALDVPASIPDDPRVELLVEAYQHVATLAAARHDVPLVLGDTVNRLLGDAEAIITAVTEQPEKLNVVLRFFTYYLPSTADLVMDRVKLASHAGATRLNEIDQTLNRLTEAFAGFKAAVLAPDLASVDIDMELLDDALDAELEDLKTR